MVQKLDADKLIKRFPSKFEPKPFYSQTNDAVYFYHEDADHHAERIDCWLTIYKAFDDERLIGFKIKNLKVLLSRFDALGLACRVSEGSWEILLQPILAFIPMAVESATVHLPDYRDVLTSFGSSIGEPLELEYA